MASCKTTELGSVARWDLQRAADGVWVVELSGRLDAGSTAEVWPLLAKRLQTEPVADLIVNAAGIEYCSGAGMALLHCLHAGGMTRGVKARIEGLRPELDRLFQAFGEQDYDTRPTEAPRRTSLVEEIGRALRVQGADLVDLTRFAGSVVRGLAANLPRARRMRWLEVRRVFETAGANALPIVSLISLLIGLILAFESAGPFATYGAQLFIADMIAVVMTRELGPLMTAIIVTGRSGSAFAAELGTMKVNEELSALETMGLDPVRFLVVQRIVAGVLIMPLLALYSMVVGICGGVLVLLSMGFPLTTIYHEMAAIIGMPDIAVGLVKGIVFGLIVATIGCWRGLRTGMGPEAVGASTTRAVVTGILLIIVADALFSVVLYRLDI